MQAEKTLTLYNNLEKSAGEVPTKKLNSTNFIDLSNFKTYLKSSFLYADDFIGIPIYMVESSSGAISLEHTHLLMNYWAAIQDFY